MDPQVGCILQLWASWHQQLLTDLLGTSPDAEIIFDLLAPGGMPLNAPEENMNLD